MALVDDDVGEGVFLAVVLEEKVPRLLALVPIQRLVGGDVDAGITGKVFAVLGLIHLCDIGTEKVFEGSESLRAEFVTITDKECLPQQAGISDALEEIHRDEGLSRSGGEGKQCPQVSPCQRFKDRADRCVLVVAADCLASRVGDEQRAGCVRFE